MKQPGPRFMLMPVGLVVGHPERHMNTPKIHYESRSGGYLGKHMQAPGITSGQRRSSGASGSRPRGGPRGNAGAVGAAVAAVQGAKRNAADGGVQRVKRQAVAPARIHGGDLKAEMKEAKKLIKDLMAHRSGWPFNKPVDITIFPQYTSVIANPMDLRTIDRKIDSNQYGTLDGFAADLKLVWSNCYQFNQDPTADVNIMAKELESIADERILRIPEELEEKRATKAEDGQTDLKKQLREQKKFNDEMKAMLQQQQETIRMQQVSGRALDMGACAPHFLALSERAHLFFFVPCIRTLLPPGAALWWSPSLPLPSPP